MIKLILITTTTSSKKAIMACSLLEVIFPMSNRFYFLLNYSVNKECHTNVCKVFHTNLIVDMSRLCTRWVEGRWWERARMPNRWWTRGHNSLLLGFHLRGNQLHIRENTLSELCNISWVENWCLYAPTDW
jgi:hypothetical protein